MALTFPFFATGLMRWREPRLMLQHRNELSPVAGGAVQAKQLAAPLWRATMRSVPLKLDEADSQMAVLRSLEGSIRSFLIHPVTRPRPVFDKSGTGPIAGVTVSAIRSDNAALKVTGLAQGFTLTAGDFLSIFTAAGGYEFLQCASGGAADGTGTTPYLSVTPHLRPSVALGDAVTLVQPLLEMRLEPDSLDDPFDGLAHRAITFNAMQVVR